MASFTEKLIGALLDTVPDEVQETYLGKTLRNRPGNLIGAITGVSRCRLEGCGGTRLHVKWSDGKRTYPCAKGCRVRDDGDLQII